MLDDMARNYAIEGAVRNTTQSAFVEIHIEVCLGAARRVSELWPGGVPAVRHGAICKGDSCVRCQGKRVISRPHFEN